MANRKTGGLAAGVGRAIAKRRIACELTQEQVAEHLGIGVEAVSRIERGVVLPTVVRLAELADIYKCHIADLVTETSSRSTDQARNLTRQLARLDVTDRELILEIIERLSNRLSKKPA